jgi:hypothetical protein
MYFQAIRRRLAEMEALEPYWTNPYVFIVGCPRSGTTLLRRIVNAHPQIAIMPESHWISRFFEKRRGLTPEGLVTSELIPSLLEDTRFTRLNIPRKKLEALMRAGQQASYSEFVSGIFNLYGKAQGKALAGNKTPWYVRRLRILHNLWPTARFVHVIRDGRDVCLSMVNWPTTHANHPGLFSTWNEDSVSTAALWWEFMVRIGRQAGRSLGPKLYYEIRYESLVNGPAEESASLCDFLGLPYDDALLRFYESQTKPKAARPITAGLRDWRSQMLADDVERFEAAAGELLDELGYSRAFPNSGSAMLQSARTIRNLLAQDPVWLDHASEGGAVDGDGIASNAEGD